jgi:threonine dehydratase
LVRSGRIGVFEVTVDDIPGKLHALTGIIAERHGNILAIEHDRLSPNLSVSQTRLVFTVETRGGDHIKEIAEAIRLRGFPAKENEMRFRPPPALDSKG